MGMSQSNSSESYSVTTRKSGKIGMECRTFPTVATQVLPTINGHH